MIVTSISSSGTGKTTNFAQIAYCLALAGYRVGIIELDDRNSFKTCLGLEAIEPETSTSVLFEQGFTGDYPFQPVWSDYTKDKIQIIQAHRDEQKKTIANLVRVGDAIALKRILEKYPPINSDLTILDCPGRSDLMSDSAILASTHIILGIEATEKCFDDVAYLFEYLYKLTDKYQVSLPKIAGFLVGRFDLNSSYQREALKLLLDQAENLGCNLFNPIRQSPYFLNCYSAGIPLKAYAVSFTGNKDFTVKGNFFKRQNKKLANFSPQFKKLPAIIPYLIEELQNA